MQYNILCSSLVNNTSKNRKKKEKKKMKTKIEEKLEERKEKKKKKSRLTLSRNPPGSLQKLWPSGVLSYPTRTCSTLSIYLFSYFVLYDSTSTYSILYSVYSCIFSLYNSLYSLYTHIHTHIYILIGPYIYILFCMPVKPRSTPILFPAANQRAGPAPTPRPALTSLSTSASADAGSVPLTQDNLPDRY